MKITKSMFLELLTRSYTLLYTTNTELSTPKLNTAIKRVITETKKNGEKMYHVSYNGSAYLDISRFEQYKGYKYMKTEIIWLDKTERREYELLAVQGNIVLKQTNTPKEGENKNIRYCYFILFDFNEHLDFEENRP